MIFIIIITLIILSSIAKAVMDKTNFHFEKSIFYDIKNENVKLWFNPYESWEFKYKDNNIEKGEKFFFKYNFFFLFY